MWYLMAPTAQTGQVQNVALGHSTPNENMTEFGSNTEWFSQKLAAVTTQRRGPCSEHRGPFNWVHGSPSRRTRARSGWKSQGQCPPQDCYVDLPKQTTTVVVPQDFERRYNGDGLLIRQCSRRFVRITPKGI